MRYKVLKITNNIGEYPEAKDDTEANKHLVRYIDDEMDIFIMDEDGSFWPADDFLI